MQINKLTKKGFTLMELLVTVILVAILASYAVYYYTDILQEGRLNAAKGKLAALGGATARFILDHPNNIQCYQHTPAISPTSLTGKCNYSVSGVDYLYNIFKCGYAEKSLGIEENFDFYIDCPSNHGCGTGGYVTAVMTPKNGQDDIFPACAYFDPDMDKVIEVRSGE